MIEVTQRNDKGNEQTLGMFTEEEFGEYFWPDVVKESFANSSIEIYKENVYVPSIDYYTKEPVFSKVAYNEKGKLLPVDYLLGLSYNYQQHRRNAFRKKHPYVPGSKRTWHRDTWIRCIKTANERKWANAWDDEEFAPKIRPSRKSSNIPTSWDERWRKYQKNWKKFRNHQWK